MARFLQSQWLIITQCWFAEIVYVEKVQSCVWSFLIAGIDTPYNVYKALRSSTNTTFRFLKSSSTCILLWNWLHTLSKMVLLYHGVAYSTFSRQIKCWQSLSCIIRIEDLSIFGSGWLHWERSGQWCSLRLNLDPALLFPINLHKIHKWGWRL